VLLATVLALTSAFLHAGWNLFAKRSTDPFLALWSNFLVAGVICTVVAAAAGGIPAMAWTWVAVSALAHVPYTVALGWAYHHGDFSLAYPIARGGGALLAALGGVAILGDDLHLLSIGAILVVVAGMWLLAYGADLAHIGAALVVAAAIGVYTVSDSHAVREYDAKAYVFAAIAGTAVAISLAGTAMGQAPALLRLRSAAWREALLGAVMTIGAYGIVLVAVRHAPVGYVAALRESSVLIAVFVGTRMLGETAARLRITAAALIVSGLGLLVISR
jgi:drug/metabolite transporter (DMT)-like permease